MANAFIQGKLEERQGELARDAVDNLEKLGPTFIKLGQIMSIRPDVLPPPVMRELAKLQDKIEPFSTPEARAMVEKVCFHGSCVAVWCSVLFGTAVWCSCCCLVQCAVCSTGYTAVWCSCCCLVPT
jgi:hypothetical protein